MRLIIVRHCQTDWNAMEKVQGKTDIPLNDTGRQQARDLAETLRSLALTRIISSPLSRARETAEIIAREYKIDLSLDERLQESSYGIFEGRKRSELDPIAPRNVFPFDLRPYGGEHSDDVIQRHLDVVRELDHDSHENILLVGHGRSLSALLYKLRREEPVKQGSVILIDGSYLKSFLSNEDSV